jgi:hypothetical protein
MLNGEVADVFDEVACAMILRGEAERVHSEESDDALILSAENHGGQSACAGIEMATLEPKAECAVLKYIRTRRSR